MDTKSIGQNLADASEISEVIMQNFPAKRKLSEILDEISQDDDLADRIEAASIEMRKSKMREVDL